jgi:hypothetical protein
MQIEDYVIEVLMRDLVGHDRRPASFLVYLWLIAEQRRCSAAVQISYQDLAENIGISKSSAQAGVAWLLRRKLLIAGKTSVTTTPRYTVQTPWKRKTSAATLVP